MFCPTVQPNCCNPCAKAVRRAWPSKSSAANGVSTPMRRIRSGCCARAASGHGRRATEQRDELATPHGLPSTGQDRILPHHRVRKPTCLAAKNHHSCPRMGWTGRAPAPNGSQSAWGLVRRRSTPMPRASKGDDCTGDRPDHLKRDSCGNRHRRCVDFGAFRECPRRFSIRR